MIDTKNLRKLTQAALAGHDGVSLNWVKLLQDFQQAASPAAISELLDRLEAAEKERDSYKFAFSEYSEKTEWVQRGINDGTVSAKYLGRHRADIMSDLLRAAEKERDALRAKVSDSAINVEYLGNLKKSYEGLIGELQDGRDALRARIEAMERQEPVACVWRCDNGHIHGSCEQTLPMGAKLYALPGAKGEEK